MIRTSLILLVCCSCLQASALKGYGEVANRNSSKKNASIADINLQNGNLLGRVVDPQGQALNHQRVELLRSDLTVVSTKTNEQGEFTLPQVTTGFYQIRCQNRTCSIRAWDESAAHPTAKPGALLVMGDTIRAQGNQHGPMDYARLATAVVGVSLGGAALMEGKDSIIVSP